MAAYATADDLQTRWRALSPSEIERANALLEDAAVFLQAEFRRCGKKIDANDELLMSALRIVSCSMVKRIMSAPIDGSDLSQRSQTAGPFTEQFTYSNPLGNMFLTDKEYSILGIAKKRSGIAQIGPRLVVDK